MALSHRSAGRVTVGHRRGGWPQDWLLCSPTCKMPPRVMLLQGRHRGLPQARAAWAAVLILCRPHTASLLRALPLNGWPTHSPGRGQQTGPKCASTPSPRSLQGSTDAHRPPWTDVDTASSSLHRALTQESLTWAGARAPVTALGPHGPTQPHTAFRGFTQASKGAQKSWMNHPRPLDSGSLWATQAGTGKEFHWEKRGGHGPHLDFPHSWGLTTRNKERL